MNTLFVMESWCDGRPDMGPTNNFHNLLGSYHNVFKEKVDTLFIDRLCYSNSHIDSLLPRVVESHKYNYIIFSFLGDSYMNPSVKLLNSLNKDSRFIFMWPDTGYEWAQRKIKNLSDFTHISWGGEEVDLGIKDHRFLWAPQDETLYYPDSKNILVSFVGSLSGYKERKEYLNFLKDRIEINISGGQREVKLSPEEYAKNIRTSKINLNFPESPSGKDQFKGRCVEILASNSILCERDNVPTKKYLKDDEYISFSLKEDLLEKLKYYLNNESEYNKVCNKGYERYKTSFSAKLFWEKALV